MEFGGRNWNFCDFVSEIYDVEMTFILSFGEGVTVYLTRLPLVSFRKMIL